MLDDSYLHKLVLFTSPVLLHLRERKTRDEEKQLILFRRHSHANISNTD